MTPLPGLTGGRDWLGIGFARGANLKNESEAIYFRVRPATDIKYIRGVTTLTN